MKKASWFIILLISFFLFEFPADAERGISVIDDLSHKSGKLGAYRALIIGINDYKDPKIPDLQTAVSDAKDMAEILIKRYGFQVNLLIDQEATKEAIYQALRNLATSTKSDDSVLIYYAGHGDLDRTYNDGWWIPSNAEGGNPVTYLDNIQVQKAMRNMNARHVLLISDSCYSGTLFGQSRGIPSAIDSKYYVNLYNEKSRWGMTSGNKTPVSDIGSGGHSVFAYQLLKELGKNEKPYISIQELCTRIAPIVSNNSEQTPLCRPIRDTGDQGGEFIFVASTDAKNITSSPELTAERTRLEQERMELERIRMEMERDNIEFERKQLEKKRLKQEKAQKELLASIPETTVNSIEKKYRLAVFPITEIGFPASDVRNQRKYIDFIIKYTNSIPNITLTHSYYPYNMDYTTQKVTPIKELIDEDTEKKIWYGNSWLAKSKPDLTMLKELSNRMDSGLVLIFKVAVESKSVVDRFKYTGYLVDIENNRSFKEFYSTEQSSSATDFGILEKMTKKLLKSYLKSNS